MYLITFVIQQFVRLNSSTKQNYAVNKKGINVIDIKSMLNNESCNDRNYLS